jgi:hypothetical protein
MATGSNEHGVEVNRGLLMGGVVLLSTAAVLGAVGGIAVTAAIVGAARTWVRQWDEPPSALARRRMAQARSAAVAGAQGWRQQSAGQATESGGQKGSQNGSQTRNVPVQASTSDTAG